MPTQRTMAFARRRNYAVLVHSTHAPSDSEWGAYLRALDGWLSEIQGILVVSDGGGPTSSQRRSLKELSEKTSRDAQVAMLSPSMLARGIVLAISLFYPHIRAFRPGDPDQALTFLRVPSKERPALLALAEQLRNEVDKA